MQKEMNLLLTSLKQAGDAIINIQKKGFSQSQKENLTPLTEADLLANEILKKNLLSAFPNDGWLSEENFDNKARMQTKRVWIVDPIDGTKEFINNIPEYAISVALIEQNVPVLSAIFNPASQELFYAIKDEGAWDNGQLILCQQPSLEKFTILASRSEHSKGQWDQLNNDSVVVKPVGSIAYKLALVAKGAAHATFTIQPRNEWDVAAGALMVQESGGVITDKFHKPLLFNQENTLINGILASTKESYDTTRELMTACMQVH